MADEITKASFKLSLLTKKDLFNAYMPFVKGGGLFISTDEKLEMGTNVAITLKLMDDLEEYSLTGKVVWINPQFAQGNLPQGVGVQFTDANAQRVRDRIENYLAGFNSEEPTHTM